MGGMIPTPPADTPTGYASEEDAYLAELEEQAERPALSAGGQRAAEALNRYNPEPGGRIFELLKDLADFCHEHHDLRLTEIAARAAHAADHRRRA